MKPFFVPEKLTFDADDCAAGKSQKEYSRQPILFPGLRSGSMVLRTIKKKRWKGYPIPSLL
jgi:hypothetical protein